MSAWIRAIPAALRLVPSWVWLLLAAVLAWHFALAWHAGKIRAVKLEAKQEQLAADVAAAARARAAAIAHKARVETKDAASADKARNDYAKDVSDLGAAYGELRRQPAPRVQSVDRGQGSVPGLSGDPGGAAAAAQGEDDRLFARALGRELAILNWPELLEHGELCDVDRSRLVRLQQIVREAAANHNSGEPLLVAPSNPTGGDNGK